MGCGIWVAIVVLGTDGTGDVSGLGLVGLGTLCSASALFELEGT